MAPKKNNNDKKRGNTHGQKLRSALTNKPKTNEEIKTKKKTK